MEKGSNFFSVVGQGANKVRNFLSGASTQDRDNHKREKFVRFGDDNLYDKYLLSLADNSAMHGAAIDITSLFIAGEGLNVVPIDPEDAAQERVAQEALEWLEDITGGLQDFHVKTARDVAPLNGFAWQIHPTRGGDNRQIKLFHRDVTTVRASKMGPTDTDVPGYFLSQDWEKATANQSKKNEWFTPRYIDRFDFKRLPRRALIYGKTYKPGKVFYPEPPYIGGLKYIEIDVEMSDFLLEDLKQGFSGNIHIHIFDAKADDAEYMKKKEDAVLKKFTTSQGQRVYITAGMPNANAPDIKSIPREGNEKMVEVISERADRKILIADKVPARLINKDLATGLSSEASDQIESMQVFQNTAIQPRQAFMCRYYDKVLKYGGFEGVKTMVKDLTPITFLVSDALRAATETIDEIRATGGKEPLPDDEGKRIVNGQIE